MNGRARQFAGFTLIELMVTVVVLAVAMTLAIPAMQELIKNNRVTGQTNELIALMSFARTEAVRRNASVTLTLAATAGGWSAEVVDPLGDGADGTSCDAGVLRCAVHGRVDLELPEGNTLDLVFNNRGYLDPFAEVDLRLEHVDCTQNQLQRRLVTVLPTGQVESCRAACGQNTCN